MTHIPIHRFGSQAAARGVRHVNHAEPLAEVPMSELRKILSSADAGCVVFTEADLLPYEAIPARATTEFLNSSALLGVLAGPDETDVAFAWSNLPIGIAALLSRPVRRSAFFLRRELADAPQASPAASLHDLLIRLSASPDRIVHVLTQDCDVAKPLPPVNAILPALVPERPGQSLAGIAGHLRQFEVSGCLSANASHIETQAVLAGLWQMQDFLDESHQCSQSIEGRGADSCGDYWHAIMHRREPDWNNSKYWFRHVGSHPVFILLSDVVTQLLTEDLPSSQAVSLHRVIADGSWDPFAFVDLCRQATQSRDPVLTRCAERLQWAEMLLLLAHTIRCASC